MLELAVLDRKGMILRAGRLERNSLRGSRKVDVIVTGGNAVSAVRQATSTIPIVFALAVDPVGSGFVNSLSRPGGNVTGLSLQGPDLAGKRLELLREVVPGRGRLAILVNAGYPAAKEELAQVQTAARALRLEFVVLEIRRAEDIAAAFEGVNDRAEALYVIGDALVSANFVQITRLALNARLPTMSRNREYVEAGCLMSYGANLLDLFRRAGDYVRQDSARGEARRSSGRTADEIRIVDQSQDR